MEKSQPNMQKKADLADNYSARDNAIASGGLFASFCTTCKGDVFDEVSGATYRTGIALFLTTPKQKQIDLNVVGYRTTSSPDPDHIMALPEPVRWTAKGKLTEAGDNLEMSYEIRPEDSSGRSHDEFVIPREALGVDFPGEFEQKLPTGTTITGEVKYRKLTSGKMLETFLEKHLHKGLEINFQALLKDERLEPYAGLLIEKAMTQYPPKEHDEYVVVDLISGRHVYCTEAAQFAAARREFGAEYSILYGMRTDGTLSTIRYSC